MTLKNFMRKFSNIEKNSGLDEITLEERIISAQALIDAFAEIRESNKDYDLMGAFYEIRKGFPRGTTDGKEDME